MHQVRSLHADLPVKPEIEEYDVTLRSQGVNVTKTLTRVANASELPITVERWRVKHKAVQSGSWVEALEKLADDKALMVEIERKRALRRQDLIVALKGGRETRLAHKDPLLLRALEGGADHLRKMPDK